ncbi:MAG: acetoacetate decarboxylase family protein [Archaeoglobales archaeon]|nr:acetoacetate decarboxylase family protein [Archaeoglobales archaeon]
MPYTPPLIEKSEVVPKGPWEYAMNVLAVHAFGDSEEISNEIGFETDGELWFYFAEIISRSPNFPELNYETPQLVQYNEAAVFVKVFVKDKSFAYCPFMYVDNDLSLVRGLLVGFPKKIANIAITKRHPLIQQSKMGANACRAGYRLLKAIVEVEKESSSVPFDKFGPWLLRRYFEPLNIDQQLIFKFEAKYGRIESGKAEIEVVGGLNDKLDAFKPEKVKSGYYYETLLKAKGVETADF